MTEPEVGSGPDWGSVDLVRHDRLARDRSHPTVRVASADRWLIGAAATRLIVESFESASPDSQGVHWTANRPGRGELGPGTLGRLSVVGGVPRYPPTPRRVCTAEAHRSGASAHCLLGCSRGEPPDLHNLT